MVDTVAAVRRFNRFYTTFVGALDRHYLGSDMTLVEARILYELATRRGPLASAIRAELDLDAGYLSRVLGRFEGRGWITREPGSDARQRPIAVTAAGEQAFAALDDKTRQAVAARVSHLLESDRLALVQALDLVERTLGSKGSTGYSIRPFRVGDMGMITARQSMLYADHYGWTKGMESLLGDVTSRFVRDFKPGREQCWIAEIGGVMVGCVFLVKASDTMAQLRLLYTEPWARGMGVGHALVGQCVDFARDCGYQEINLWTHTVLTSARRIYEAVGFRLQSTAIHEEFGTPVQGETWSMPLGR